MKHPRFRSIESGYLSLNTHVFLDSQVAVFDYQSVTCKIVESCRSCISCSALQSHAQFYLYTSTIPSRPIPEHECTFTQFWCKTYLLFTCTQTYPTWLCLPRSFAGTAAHSALPSSELKPAPVTGPMANKTWA